MRNRPSARAHRLGAVRRWDYRLPYRRRRLAVNPWTGLPSLGGDENTDDEPADEEDDPVDELDDFESELPVAAPESPDPTEDEGETDAPTEPDEEPDVP